MSGDTDYNGRQDAVLARDHIDGLHGVDHPACPVCRPPSMRGHSKKITKVLTALAEHGWYRVDDVSAAGESGYNPHGQPTYLDPANDVEHETPAWAQERRPLIGALWPSPTYTIQRSVTFVGSKVFVRIHEAPWVNASVREVSGSAAVTWLEAL